MRLRLKLDHLHELIARSNLSQNHWAMKLGLSRGHWSDIVNGKHPYPSAKTRERMVEVFSIEVADLFEVESGGWSDQSFKQAISDRYLIDQELGHGGMGTVYLARDVKLGRTVAIKVVSPEAVSGIGVKQFLKEIRYSARLEHHNILPLHDAGEASGYPYYVMPYVRGGSLRDLLDRRQRLSVEETIKLVRGVALALSYAHDNHVLHCDVKPANVLLSGDHTYVADFGISRAIHAEAFEWGKPTSLDTSAGTPAYVSPEQAGGERDLDPRSDVYSLACMTYEMLGGTAPFKGKSTVAIIAQRFTEEAPDLRRIAPEVPVRIASAVKRGMSLDLERRPQTASEFVHSLERGVAHVMPARERLSLLRTRVSALRSRVLGRGPSAGKPAPATIVKGMQMLGSIKQDVIYAMRTFKRAPAYAAVVVLTLAFGIAANALVFSLMSPYFLRPLPFADADKLVQLGQVDSVIGWDGVRFSLPQLNDYRQQSRAFEDLGAYYYGSRNLTGVEGPEQVMVGFVTANMFSVLQAEPGLGRWFLPDEGEVSGPEVVMLDNGLWQRRYGADPGLIGQSITIDGISRTVVGVMREDFVFPFGGIDIWLPIRADVSGQGRGERANTIMVGRLAADWTIERAREEVNAVHAGLADLYPEVDGRFAGISVKPLRQALNFVWDILKVTFALLLAAVGFALIIVCVNVASLTLARSTARTGELAVRKALGAGRGRIVRQLLTESVILALAGGVIGVLVAHWGSGILGPLIPEDWYRVGEASIDGGVLLFTLAVTLMTVVLFGLAPALSSSRADLSAALKEGGRSGFGLQSMRFRRALVVFEVAAAVVLVSGMGLAARSFLAMQDVELGFEEDRVISVVANPPRFEYPEVADIQSFYDRAIAEIEALPGVRAAATADALPLNHEVSISGFSHPARTPASVEDWSLGLSNWVSPGYFEAMGIPMVVGRDFETGDSRDGPPVAIVSQRLASELWPGETGLGEGILLAEEQDQYTRATVIGVVADVAFESVAPGERPQIYLPIEDTSNRRRYIVAAASGPASGIVNPVRQAMLRVDGNLPVSIMTMEYIVGQNMLPWSISSILLGFLGGASLLLASLGVYGIIAYSVAQRRREIGLRLALGASTGGVRRLFVGEGVKLSAAGLGLGIVLSLVMSNLLQAVLFGVGAFDPVTFIGVLVIFLLVAAAASLVPAIRASRVDPIGVLRYE
ncbi:MAG: ABC transporter permease [Gemmatimonadota bacterium]|nr:MAG: ABC transporter permease [Gemmatimonadota bacterium]